MMLNWKYSNPVTLDSCIIWTYCQQSHNHQCPPLINYCSQRQVKIPNVYLIPGLATKVIHLVHLISVVSGVSTAGRAFKLIILQLLSRRRKKVPQMFKTEGFSEFYDRFRIEKLTILGIYMHRRNEERSQGVPWAPTIRSQ